MSEKKILIIEDDLDLAKALTKRLEANSYEIVCAFDAISATEVARKEKPDLIILDIGLPGGDGFVVKKRLDMYASLSDIPIIVITGQDVTSIFERSVKANVEAFFQKLTLVNLTSSAKICMSKFTNFSKLRHANFSGRGFKSAILKHDVIKSIINMLNNIHCRESVIHFYNEIICEYDVSLIARRIEKIYYSAME